MVVQRRKTSNLPPAQPSEADLQARAALMAQIKAAQAQDAPRATREYREAQEAVRVKTEKLRAARLARDSTIKT